LKGLNKGHLKNNTGLISEIVGAENEISREMLKT